MTGQAAANFLNSLKHLGALGFTGGRIGEPGGGGSSYVGKTTTGTHSVDSRCFTSKNGSNDPGDLKSAGKHKEFVPGSFSARHGATGVEANGVYIFSNEQQGRYALASLLDGNYGNDSISTFTNKYNPPTHEYPNQNKTETLNIENFMAANGDTNFTGSINSMSNSEFNTFLDAITKAEGVINMKGC